MARRFEGTKLVVASHNEGKVREIAELLEGRGVNAVSARTLGLAEPEETGTSYAQNAILKARAAAKAARLPALADDSGLSVDALDGAPGIYSARWAGPERDFLHAMREVERCLRERNALGSNERRARFYCALTLAWPDGHAETFMGSVDGHLVWPPRGLNGFGYDAMFVPDGYSETFGEMEPAKKHKISHRAHAFAALIKACF